VSSGPVISVSQSNSDVLLAQDPASLEVLSSVSFEASLKAEGSSPIPECFAFGFVDFGSIHSWGLLWVTSILGVSLFHLSRFSSFSVDLT